MDELVNLVVEKTGLPKETAKTVVTLVLDFLKKKLPAPVAAQVETVLSGKGMTGAVASALDDGKLDANDAANLLGGLLGGKK
ncbi:MAG: hypothetical protein DDG60_02610 [Anaerolineae bacterium]|nr:MAG: hypothetical protein DDG60_02610 [Anaerolineae bacterium]